jgi:hypothetical protein
MFFQRLKNKSSQDLDKVVIHEIDKNWVNKLNTVLIYPDSNIFLDLVVESVINFELNFQVKGNPIRRTSILIVSRNRELLKKIQDINVKTKDVFEFCNSYHEYLRDKDIFCDLNDKSFSMLYWSTYFSRYYSDNIPEEVPMHFIFPIASGRQNFTPISRGERNKIGRNDNTQQPTFIFTDTLKTVENSSHEFDYIFVDGATIKGQINVMRKWNNPYFIFLDNPLDIRVPYLLKNESKNYVVDNFMYKRLSNSEGVIELPSVEINNINFKYIQAAFEETLEKAFELMNKLYRDKFSGSDLKIIKTLLYNVVRMTIEGIEYDFIAGFDPQYDSIKDMIKELKDSDFRYDSSDFEEVIELIEDIYNKYQLDMISPKFEALEKLIDKVVEVNEKVLVVASGKIDSLGLKEKISLNLKIDITELESRGIYIKSYQDVKSIKSADFDLVVLTSAIRVSDLQPILRNLGKKVIVFLYQLEVIQLKAKFKLLAESENELSLSLLNVPEEIIYKTLYKKVRRIDRHKEIKVEVENLLDSINLISPDFSNRLNKPCTLENAVKTKLVTFTDSSKVFLQPGSAVRYLLKSKKDVKQQHLKKLKGNEEILIIKNNIKEDLYEIFIANLSERDLAKQHYQNIREWRKIYEDKFIFLKLDDNKLFERMISLGWGKLTKGILKNWRSGYSYGPRDLEDIRTLGKALNLDAFIESAEHFHDSMEHIRTERRVAARILNKVIYLSSKSIDSTDNSFLENYNLSLEDIQEAIEIKKMASISDRTYMVKPSEVGRIFK